MASPKTHAIASAVLVLLYVIGFFIGFVLNWSDVLWIVIFGVLIDVDHVPFGRLWFGFMVNNWDGVKRIYQLYGWFDENHLNLLHTWPAMIMVIILSYIIGSVWPLAAYGIHMLIDGGSQDQLIYPKCSPLPRDICRHLGRFYPAWAKYHTNNIPEKEVM